MILGVTGSIGAGKSTVKEEFSRLGWRVFDADAVCHDIYADPGSAFFSRIVGTWGRGTAAPDGRSIDRKKLAQKVFGRPEELKKLTDLLYPELEKRLDAAIAACRKEKADGIFEIPLLFENGYEKRFDAVLAVWSAFPVRCRRLEEKRALGGEEIRQREAAQLPAGEKLELADLALVNNGSRELLRRQVGVLAGKISSMTTVK
ncbi:MAG: dephospho-CoA kinase [Lentisphaeria bacterium]|nr:dephospho-CoA kinase [Lentisphaeria bacterium]